MASIDKDCTFGGHLSGYVKIPDGCPIKHGTYDVDVDVHGGITYNVKEDGEHWIGFDCGHCEDIIPSIRVLCKKMNIHNYKDNFMCTYRGFYYVVIETRNLAEQVRALIDE